MIKLIAATATVIFMLCGFIVPASEQGDTKGPCGNENYSNSEIRQCYAKEQLNVNAQADVLANEIAVKFRREAKDKDFGDGPISDSLKKAAAEVLQSQSAWKAYRNHHCQALADSYTFGSGAGAAYEQCMYELGRLRLRELDETFK